MTLDRNILPVFVTIACSVGLATHVSAVEAGGVTPVPRALESGGTGCYDPESPVWAAPRAELVQIDRFFEGPCEIGTEACHRRPESTPVESDVVGEVVCTLKVGPTSHDVKAAKLATTERCVAIVMNDRASLLQTLPPPVRDRGPVCAVDDPECSPLPPPAIPLSTSSTAAPAALLPSPPQLPPREVASLALDVPGRARRGHPRAVDRPPTQPDRLAFS